MEAHLARTVAQLPYGSEVAQSLQLRGQVRRRVSRGSVTLGPEAEARTDVPFFNLGFLLSWFPVLGYFFPFEIVRTSKASDSLPMNTSDTRHSSIICRWPADFSRKYATRASSPLWTLPSC